MNKIFLIKWNCCSLISLSKQSIGMFFFICLFSACVKNTTTNDSIVNDSDIEVITSKLPISSFVKIKRMIPLETNNTSLLGNIEKIMKRNDRYFIKSSNRSLAVFDQSGMYLNAIGNLGNGPEEYPTLLDFDVDSEFVYILTTNRINIYNQQGKCVKFIPLLLNVAGFKVVKDKILLFVLGDSHVVHLIDLDGVTIEKKLSRDPALRLTKAISFVRYGNDYLLFPKGHSNDILAYNIAKSKFENLNYLSSSNNLSPEYSKNTLDANKIDHEDEPNKRLFDGLTSTSSQTIFGSIEGDKIILWVKDVAKNLTTAYSFAALIDDLTYTSSDFLVKENTDGGDVFLSYLFPYSLEDGLKKNQKLSENENFKFIEAMLENLDIEESNPVIIEYIFK